jgi:putative transposase
VLSEHGLKIAPSTYYDSVTRRPSKRALRDAEIVELIQAERTRQKLFARFGARKMWLHLRSRGHDVARCTIERLYAEQGWVGALRHKKVRTTIPDESADRPADLVDRQFFATCPNQLWVADFTYVATWSGMVYVAFVFDVFSRRIVGWRAATRMTTDLVLDTVEHAIWTRRQSGIEDLTGLVHHTDAGSQGGFQWSSQHLDERGVPWLQARGVRRTRSAAVAGSEMRIGRSGRRCGRREGRASTSVRWSESSGSASPKVSRARRLPSRAACRPRSAPAGSATVAGCH